MRLLGVLRRMWGAIVFRKVVSMEHDVRVLYAYRLICLSLFFLCQPSLITLAQNMSSTGSTHPAEYDAEGKPITAGGFVASGPVVFQDVTKDAGLGQWRHVMGGPEKT